MQKRRTPGRRTVAVGARRRVGALIALVVVAATISPFGVLGASSPASAVPGSGTANNPFPNTCNIKVGLVMDRSNSIRSNDANNPTLMKDAAKGMVDHLVGTGASVAVWSFGTLASGYTGSNPVGGSVAAGDYPAVGFTAVPGAAGATTVKNVIDSVPFSTSSDLGGTNWEAGLGRSSNGYPGAVAPNGDKPQDADVLIFLTDGNPTLNNGDFGSGGTVNDADVNAGITAANAIKSTGPATRVIGVGIGSAVTTANLERVTGGYPASVENDDYWLTNFDQLQDTLFDISTRFCGGNLTIRKLVPGQQPGSWVPQPGWTFATTFPQGNPSFLTPAAGNQNTDANGEVNYQWVQGSPTSAHISETLGANQVLVSSQCTTDQGQPVSYDTTALDVAVPVNSKVVCEFKNRPVGPSLSITKTPSVPAVTGADRAVTYTLQITNTSSLDSVQLTGLADSKFGDLFDGTNASVTSNTCLAKAGTVLAPGGSTSCTFTAQVLGASGGANDPHQNTVVVAGVDTVLEHPVTAQATASVDILAPAIDLAKTVDKPVVTTGTSVTYTLTATNPGDTPLKNVTVTDPDCGAISGPTKNGGDQDALLEAGESWVYTCSATIGADKTNTATANAQDNVLSTPVSDTASASVDVIAPAIHIVKTADKTVVTPGTTVNYTLTVTNTGDTPLKNVGVNDPDCGPVSGPTKTGGDQDALLEAGEIWTYTCSAPIAADHTNTATVLGQDTILSTTVTDDDSASVRVITPGIHLEKDVDQPVVLSGTSVTYTLAATNPSGVPLTGVTVSDPNCGAISGPTKAGGDQDADLETGETWTYTCSATITADTTNTATVEAVDSVLQTKVSDTDTASVDVIAPAIHIAKTVDKPTVLSGATVTYTLGVTNAGDTPLANVGVTDPGCGAISGPVKTGGDQDALLEAGEVWAYTCTATVTADTTNTATASAVDGVLQTNVSDSDSVDVDVIAPAIHLTKTVDTPVVLSGATVTFTMVATNTGDTPLGTVALTDADCAPVSGPVKAGGDQDALLEAGETWTYTCTKAITADTTNHASVSASDTTLQTPVSDTATADVDVIAPAIHLTKSVDQPVVLSGTSVTYTMVATNTGDTPLVTVDVTDPDCGPITGPVKAGGDQDTLLEAGETWTYTCTKVITADKTNTATVTAIDNRLETKVSDDASADVDVIAPAIHLEKDVDLPVVLSGTNVTYTMVATNTGDTALSSVSVTDPDCAPITGPAKAGGDQDDLLEAGETWTYTCTKAITADTTNTAVVSAFDNQIQTPVADSDTAEVDVIGPAIDLTKSVDKPVVLSGTDVTYTMVATNAGDTPLASVSLTDPGCTPISGPAKAGGDQDDLLEIGETWTYTCTKSISDDTVNTATVNAVEARTQTPVSDSASATVIVIDPAIHLAKSVDKPVVLSGTSVTYTMVATNTGDTPLTSVTISDPDCSPVTGPVKAGGNQDDLLEAGETWTYTCTTAITADTTNTATVSAVDNRIQTPVSDDDSASVDVIAPAIAIDKATSTPAIKAGDTASYTYTVTTAGDVPIASVTVTDDKCSPVTFVDGDTDADQLLDPGETWNYTCETTLDTDTVNTATAAGSDAVLGSPVSATDTAAVKVAPLVPAISLVKTADPTTALVGDTITYTYEVTNTGEVDLTDLALDDDKLGEITLDATDLAVGASTTATATHEVALDEAGTTIHNVAVVTGTGGGTEVTATDTADVTVAQQEAVTSTSTPTSQAPATVTPGTESPAVSGTPLARTGTDVWAMVRLAFLLIGAGAVALLAVRRRRSA